MDAMAGFLQQQKRQLELYFATIITNKHSTHHHHIFLFPFFFSTFVISTRHTYSWFQVHTLKRTRRMEVSGPLCFQTENSAPSANCKMLFFYISFSKWSRISAKKGFPTCKNKKTNGIAGLASLKPFPLLCMLNELWLAKLTKNKYLANWKF